MKYLIERIRKDITGELEKHKGKRVTKKLKKELVNTAMQRVMRSAAVNSVGDIAGAVEMNMSASKDINSIELTLKIPVIMENN